MALQAYFPAVVCKLGLHSRSCALHPDLLAEARAAPQLPEQHQERRGRSECRHSHAQPGHPDGPPTQLLHSVFLKQLQREAPKRRQHGTVIHRKRASRTSHCQRRSCAVVNLKMTNMLHWTLGDALLLIVWHPAGVIVLSGSSLQNLAGHFEKAKLSGGMPIFAPIPGSTLVCDLLGLWK